MSVFIFFLSLPVNGRPRRPFQLISEVIVPCDADIDRIILGCKNRERQCDGSSETLRRAQSEWNPLSTGRLRADHYPKALSENRLFPCCYQRYYSRFIMNS